MREWFERFMSGRYGVDELSRFLLGVCVVLMVLNLFLRQPVLNFVILAGFVWIYFRMFSRNFMLQSAQNEKYLSIKNRILSFFRRQGNTAKDLRTNHIYKCPSCGQKIRVPRGKGKICITCPKCKHEFIKKS